MRRPNCRKAFTISNESPSLHCYSTGMIVENNGVERAVISMDIVKWELLVVGWWW